MTSRRNLEATSIRFIEEPSDTTLVQFDYNGTATVPEPGDELAFGTSIYRVIRRRFKYDKHEIGVDVYVQVFTP